MRLKQNTKVYEISERRKSKQEIFFRYDKFAK